MRKVIQTDLKLSYFWIEFILSVVFYYFCREEEREDARRSKVQKVKRYTMIGLATLGGGAVLGLTGGLAAPFIGAGLGTIIGAGMYVYVWQKSNFHNQDLFGIS